ncbi:MAG: hypothetical protein OYK82_01500 [Gammaproteobacteria bacterium]|nr:hypothetical protein [Gammaproteobacteria bacterium]
MKQSRTDEFSTHLVSELRERKTPPTMNVNTDPLQYGELVA